MERRQHNTPFFQALGPVTRTHRPVERPKRHVTGFAGHLHKNAIRKGQCRAAAELFDRGSNRVRVLSSRAASL
jgi:hypothetical protein